MLSINTNLSSLVAQTSMKSSTNKLNQAIERMTTGFKINHAKDNAANYNIASNMTTQINSLDVAEDNVSQGLDLINTSNQLLDEINDRVTRLRNLQVQASNSTYGEESLKAINAEVNALVDEVQRLYQTAEYNGIKLFMETQEDASGNHYYEQESYADESSTFEQLGLSASSFNIHSQDGTLLQTYDVLETDTLGDFLTTLTLEGFNANINGGQITISSNDGKYITGNLADSLGIDTKNTSYVASTEQSFNNQIPVTTESTTVITEMTTTTTSTTQTSTTYTTVTIESTTTTTTETVNMVYTVQTETLMIPETAAATFGMRSGVAPVSETGGFIEPVTRRDTSTMKTMTDLVNGITSATKEYSISTKEELVALADYVNSGKNTSGMIFVLSADIDLSSISNWTPIGDYSTRSSYSFKGSFDGNGHVIKNVTIDNEAKGYQGLFGHTGQDAVIKNVGVENCSVTGNSYVGGLIGTAAYSSTVSNCYSTGTVSGNSYVGGLIGYVTSDSSDPTTVSNCYSAGTVSGNSYIGGLIGEASSQYTSVSNCHATGDITGSGYVGGLIGKASTVSNCYATGAVIGNSDVGGLIGMASSVSNCYATGTVSGNSAVGGLIGQFYNSSSTIAALISNCYSTGDVTGSGDRVGGLVGYYRLIYSTTYLISNCYATGIVRGGDYIGGLVGSASGSAGNLSINNCYSTGDITGSGYVGGLTGYLAPPSNSTTTVSNCYTTGTVSGNSRVGGLVGMAVSSSFSNCATVQSDSKATQMTEEQIKSTYTSDSMGFTEANGWTIVGDTPLLSWQQEAQPVTYTTATLDTTLGELGASGSTTIALPNSTITMSSTKTIEELLEEIRKDSAVTSAELVDGVLLITTANASLDLTSGFLSLYNPTQTSNTTTNTVTTTETILVEQVTETPVTETIWHTTTSETTRTETLTTTSTISLSGSTTFGELGIQSTLRVTVLSDGTKNILNIAKDTTLDAFYSELLALGIETTTDGNTITFTGQGNSYIDSDNLEDLLGLSSVSTTMGTKATNTESEPLFAIEKIYGIYAPGQVSLQVGTGAQSSSQIEVDVSFKLRGINELRNIGVDLTTDYLSILDDMLTEITNKQTQFGAASNRLESVLDEISIRRENLVSSRSTIRDADITEVSSEYIMQQILQQASATLLATANQSPAIALQLI